jgi:hypothetical protein
MTSVTHNHSLLLAEGFVAVFVNPAPSLADRQAMVASLVSVFESVYAFGLNRAQLEFANKLISTIGSRSDVPAGELISLASSLNE